MTAPIVHPGDIAEGPVRRSSSQAGLAAVKYGPKVPPIDPDDPTSKALPVIGDTVLLSDGTTGRVTGRLRATWRVETDARTRYVYLHQIAGYPDDPTDPPGGAVTDHAPAPSGDTAPDHGPLAAPLSDRTLAKVLSRPAHVPSLVALDEAHSAAGVIKAAMRWEETENGAPWDHAEAEMALRKAVIDYRETVS